MESPIGLLGCRMVLTEDMREELKRIELLSQKVYDVAARPDPLIDYASGLRAEDLAFAGEDTVPGHVRDVLSGDVCDEGICGRLAGLRFSDRRDLPWTVDTVSSVHRRLTEGRSGFDPGRLRNGPYTSVGKGDVDESLQSYAESELSDALNILNVSPYHPLISAALFWNCLEMIQPFQGDNSFVYRELLRMALCARNYRGADSAPLSRRLAESDGLLRDAREHFLRTWDPNPMISSTVGCIRAAFEDAYAVLGPMDVKRSVDGLSRSIIRNSRRRESFALAETHSWLGDISDQTFRSRINGLIDMGILRKVGNTRSTRYVYVDPFEMIRRANGGKFPHLDDDALQLFYTGVGPIARP